MVDVSLLNAAIWQLGPDIVGAGITGQDIPKFNLEEMPNPVASMYKTKDGRFVAFVLLQADRFWSDFCTRLGRRDLIDDERYANAAVRFQNRADCIAELRKTFESEELSHWEQAFAGFEGVWDVVHTAHEVHSDKQALIILDNCEHVIGAAAALAEEIIRAAPGIRILATSREPLRAVGEWRHRLAPLSFPSEAADLDTSAALQFSAIQLFSERASASVDEFTFVDLVNIFKPVTYLSKHVHKTERVIDAIHDAFRVAMSGKRGPVMLNIPRDLLDHTTIDYSPQSPDRYRPTQQRAR